MRHFARFTLRAFLASLFFLTLSLTPSVQAASTRLVSTTGSDSGDCTGSPCATIAYAISQATAGDTINVTAGTYTEAGINIVDKNLTITGAGAASTIVQAAASAGIATDRVFQLNDALTPFDMTGTIEAMTIRYGVSGSGGGVNNSAALTLNDVVISDNQTNSLNGGGISSNAGSVTLNNSTVSGNQSASNGGGIYVSVANLTLNNSTVSGNTAAGSGGGIYTNSGTTSLNYSTIANNTSDSSGAGDGGGVYNTSGAINLKSSIVAGNLKDGATDDAADCSGAVTSQDYNLTGSFTGCPTGGIGDVTVSTFTVFTAVLGALADNGGSTFTHALMLASPARHVIPSGTNDCGTSPFDEDQRGSVRPVGSNCDIGAYEAGNLIVTNNNDSGAGSLRQAIADAVAGDIISFDAPLSGGTISLGSTLVIPQNVTIDGSSLTEKITISGAGVGIFNVPIGVTATLNSLIVTQGSANEGGGLFNNGTVIITNSVFSANTANNAGGAIWNNATGTLTITGSTFSNNSAVEGGGIANYNQLTVTNSTFTDNSALSNAGGAIYTTGLEPTLTQTITNSTFSGNSAATVGGAIFSSRSQTITNSTFSGNSAPAGANGGAIWQDEQTLNFTNTIIANSPLGGDCVSVSTIVTNINNLVEDGSCATNGVGFQTGDPNLGSLASNGGSTQTFALLAGSKAINAGDDTTCNAAPVGGFDQRGVARPNGDHCDIGAYEYADASAPIVTGFTATSPSRLNVPITIFTASDDATLAGYLVTETSTPPSAGAAGWTASAPTTYIVASDGSYALYPWAKDAVGHVSAVYGSPASVTVETTAPSVVSSVRASANPTNAASVDFTITFSESVTGVDTTDFSLTITGVTGAAVSGVSGSGATRTVSVNTGSGNGTIRLDLHDNDSITDSAGNPLGGSGLANGNFVTDEYYTIDKTAPTAGSLVATNVTTDGGTTYSFIVSFSDNRAIDSTSIDGSDIRVTEPGGFDQRATLVSVTPAGNGTPRTATYQITAPDGAWDTTDNGTYTIGLEANQVIDTAGNPVGAASLGSFLVSLNYTVYLPLVLR